MDCVNHIMNNINVRESLISLKRIIENEPSLSLNIDLKEQLILLLDHEDPKVRKNTAIILGYFQNTAALLLKAYYKEKTEYVKEAYLKGMSLQNCRKYLTDLKKIQTSLMHQESVSSKHIQAQLKVLNPLILSTYQHKKKMIKLKHEPVDVILTTLPYYQFVAFEYVLANKYKPVSQGVLVRSDSLYDLQTIRVYKDMIIPLGLSYLEPKIEAIEEGLKRWHLIDILSKLYDEGDIFYYRVVDGMREKNSQLVKQVSQKIFELYPHQLLNSSENYDIEIILKEVRKGTVNLYLKLSHLKNPRFIYRKNVIATSMQPYVAATLVQLAKPYMKDYGKVLDPFAGTGTLLIEKNMVIPSRFAMGVDVYSDGIEMAKKNAKFANQTIHFVHKDALRFSTSELFDEILTDMPTLAQVKDAEHLRELYDRFFTRIPHLIKPGGYIFLYTSEISLIRKNLRLQEGYLSLEEHYDIPRGKNMFYFFIIKVK
ncbi:MAG: methyltransferase domain-containing protein [Erysipelotrichales bacterium]|nr:methyltransferase domain-containing protein [Erysipelotrichales bacterium]